MGSAARFRILCRRPIDRFVIPIAPSDDSNEITRMSTATTATGAAPRSADDSDDSDDLSTILLDGFMAGAVGGLIVALWFLVTDTVAGHPLHTPMLFYTAMFEGPAAVAEGVEFHAGPVAIYSLVHLAAYFLLGSAVFLAARRLSGGARTAVLLALFAVLVVGMYAVTAVVWPPVAAEIPLLSALGANLLGAGGVAYYLKLRTGRVV